MIGSENHVMNLAFTIHEDKLLVIDSLGYQFKNLVRCKDAKFALEHILVIS